MWLAATLSAMVLTACSQPEPEHAVSNLGLAIEGEADSALLERATLVFVDRCMVERGFDAPYASLPKEVQAAYEEHALGVVDRERALQHGYGLSPEEQRQAISSSYLDEDHAAIVQLPESARLELTEGDDSCMAVGKNRYLNELDSRSAGFSKRFDSTMMVASDIVYGAHDSAIADADYKSALVQWVECMSKEGYRVSRPAIAPQELDFVRPVKEGTVTQPSQEEISAAVVDIDCKSKSQIIEAYNAANIRYRGNLFKDKDINYSQVQRDLQLAVDFSRETLK